MHLHVLHTKILREKHPHSQLSRILTNISEQLPIRDKHLQQTFILFMARCGLLVLKVPLNPNQPDSRHFLRTEVTSVLPKPNAGDNERGLSGECSRISQQGLNRRLEATFVASLVLFDWMVKPRGGFKEWPLRQWLTRPSRNEKRRPFGWTHF